MGKVSTYSQMVKDMMEKFAMALGMVMVFTTIKTGIFTLVSGGKTRKMGLVNLNIKIYRNNTKEIL